MLAFQRHRQRRAAAYGVADVGDDAAAFVVFGQIHQDRQRAVQRLPGADQRRQLLGELHQRGIVERLLAQQHAQRRRTVFAGGQTRFYRQVALLLQTQRHLGIVGRFHLTIEHFAVRIERLVAVQGH